MKGSTAAPQNVEIHRGTLIKRVGEVDRAQDNPVLFVGDNNNDVFILGYENHVESTVGFSGNPPYKHTVDKAAIIRAAADLLSAVYHTADVDRALEGLAAKLAADETAARAKVKPRLKKAATETTIGPPEPTAPIAAPPEWPSEKWKGSPEELSRKPFAIFVFLRRVWKPFIDETDALVTRQILIECDRAAGLALKDALRGRRPMPGDIRIVRTSELKNTVSGGPVLYLPKMHN